MSKPFGKYLAAYTANLAPAAALNAAIRRAGLGRYFRAAAPNVYGAVGVAARTGAVPPAAYAALAALAPAALPVFWFNAPLGLAEFRPR